MRWKPGRKYKELRLRIDAVDSIVAVKEVFSYEELSSLLNIPPSVLSRYYQGMTIPNISTSRDILEVLTSKEFVRTYMKKLIDRRYSGSVNKALSNPKVINYLSIYLYNRIVNVLKGTSINAVISPADQSVPLASHIAYRLGVSFLIIPSVIAQTCEDLRIAGIDRGSSVVAIYAFFGKDCLTYLRKFINCFKLDLKLIEAVVLTDFIYPTQIPKKAPIEYILP